MSATSAEESAEDVITWPSFLSFTQHILNLYRKAYILRLKYGVATDLKSKLELMIATEISPYLAEYSTVEMTEYPERNPTSNSRYFEGELKREEQDLIKKLGSSFNPEVSYDEPKPKSISKSISATEILNKIVSGIPFTETNKSALVNGLGMSKDQILPLVSSYLDSKSMIKLSQTSKAIHESVLDSANQAKEKMLRNFILKTQSEMHVLLKQTYSFFLEIQWVDEGSVCKLFQQAFVDMWESRRGKYNFDGASTAEMRKQAIYNTIEKLNSLQLYNEVADMITKFVRLCKQNLLKLNEEYNHGYDRYQYSVSGVRLPHPTFSIIVGNLDSFVQRNYKFFWEYLSGKPLDNKFESDRSDSNFPTCQTLEVIADKVTMEKKEQSEGKECLCTRCNKPIKREQ